MEPNDGILDTLPNYSEERSSILIEPTKKVNIGTTKNPKIIHLVESLSCIEKEEFIQFLKERKVNFACSYADMLGLDPKLILHHLNIALGAKPIK